MSKIRSYAPFGLAVLIQLCLLGAVCAQRVIPLYAGRTVLLKIEPVDPYDIFRGYYLNLEYEISRLGSLNRGHLPKKGRAYVVLQESNKGVWKAVSVHAKWPSEVPENALVIKARKEYSHFTYGLESFYVPETERSRIESELRKNISDAYAEVSVGPFGNATILRLRVKDKLYEY